MDRHDLVDRLPGERLRQRLPSVWEPADDDPDAPDHRDDDGPEPELATPPEEPPADDEATDRTRTLRSALLGVALGSGVVAVLAALVRRMLGRGDDEDEAPAEMEPQQEEEETAPPLDEGTAAALGLAFLLAGEALRDWLRG